MPLNSSAISASNGSSETGSRTLKSPSFRSRMAESNRRRSASRTLPPLLRPVRSRSPPPSLPFPFRFPFLPLPAFRPFFRREPVAVGERVELSSDSISSTSILSPISTTLLLDVTAPARGGGASDSRLDPGKASGRGMYSTVQKWDRSGNGSDPVFIPVARSVPRHRRSGCLPRREPRVNPAPPRVELLRDSNESAVDERVPDRFAGGSERGDFEKYVLSEAKPCSRHHELPIDAFDCHVFASRPNVDRMPFRLQSTDPFD